jgi:hypothetical protein
MNFKTVLYFTYASLPSDIYAAKVIFSPVRPIIAVELDLIRRSYDYSKEIKLFHENEILASFP